MPKNVDPTPQQYRDLYDKADSFAREVWQFRGTVALPAHNQLRYAGHHLLKSLGRALNTLNRFLQIGVVTPGWREILQ